MNANHCNSKRWGTTQRLLVLAASVALVMSAPMPASAQGLWDYFALRWLNTERISFRILSDKLVRDERAARAELSKLYTVRNGAVRFVNGGNSPADQVALRLVLKNVLSTPAVNSLLRTDIPPLGPEQFGKRADMMIVRCDGRLAQPPHVLRGKDAADPLRKQARIVAAQWQQIAANLRVGRPVSDESVSKFEQVLADWKESAQESIVVAPESQQAKARAYLISARFLVKVLRDERRTETLVRFLRSADGGFAGGTVGELVQHIVDNNLTLRYGSQTHALFTELMYDLKNEVDARIVMLEDRVERYKAQNPAHNAALKEQLISWPYYYGWRPNTRWGFPGYRGYWGYPRPSTFNFSQGEQPAGLQSKAYGRPLPQGRSSQEASALATSVERVRSVLNYGGSQDKPGHATRQTASR